MRRLPPQFWRMTGDVGPAFRTADKTERMLADLPVVGRGFRRMMGYRVERSRYTRYAYDPKTNRVLRATKGKVEGTPQVTTTPFFQNVLRGSSRTRPPNWIRGKAGSFLSKHVTITRPLYGVLEKAEEATGRGGGRMISRARAYFTDPVVPPAAFKPGGAVHAEKARLRKTPGLVGNIRTSLRREIMTNPSLRITQPEMTDPERWRAISKATTDAAERFLDRQATLHLRDQFPSRIERLTNRVFDPAVSRLKAANDRANAWAIRRAVRMGLPVKTQMGRGAKSEMDRLDDAVAGFFKRRASQAHPDNETPI